MANVSIYLQKTAPTVAYSRKYDSIVTKQSWHTGISFLSRVMVDNSFCAEDLTETCVSEVIVIMSPIVSNAGSARTPLLANGRRDIKISLGKNGRVTVDDQRIVLPRIHGIVKFNPLQY